MIISYNHLSLYKLNYFIHIITLSYIITWQKRLNSYHFVHLWRTITIWRLFMWSMICLLVISFIGWLNTLPKMVILKRPLRYCTNRWLILLYLNLNKWLTMRTLMLIIHLLKYSKNERTALVEWQSPLIIFIGLITVSFIIIPWVSF